MWQDGLNRLSEHIFYLPASDDPLSADVFFIETDVCVYVYDVGSCAAARERIEGIKKDKIVVLSHFHTDHTANLGEITFRSLYAGRETLKHVGSGNVVEGEIVLEPVLPIRLVSLPSSHAKDCVMLCYRNEYAFCGDAVYAAQKKLQTVYNAQKLKAMMDVLGALDVKYLVLSHEKNPVHCKEEVIRSLEMIYGRRDKNSAYIVL